jgi:hypothetical protein
MSSRKTELVDLAQSTRFDLIDDPAHALLVGMNALAWMRLIDWRTSSSRSEKDSRAKWGFIPTSSWICPFTSSSEKVSIPQSVWWTNLIVGYDPASVAHHPPKARVSRSRVGSIHELLRGGLLGNVYTKGGENDARKGRKAAR